MARLLVNPCGHIMVDDKLEIKIVGLNKRQRVTVHAETQEGDRVFESYCCYTSDGNGEVNLASQQSEAGSYTGVSPMGIFWSMVPAPGQRDGVRLIKKDVTKPLTTKVCVYNGHLTVNAIHSTKPKPLCTGSIDRWYMGVGVKREVVKHGRIRGILFLPAGQGPFPGVIDMFGGVGGIVEFRAALLASHGFACLSLPYFMYQDLPDSLFDVEFEYFLEAIDWLCHHEDVYHDGLGIVAVSRGGEMALLMAAHSEKVKCVVNISGNMFISTFGVYYRDGYIPAVTFDLEKINIFDGALSTRDCWNYSKDYITTVWKNNAKILNIIGEDDLSTPAENVYFAKDLFPQEKRDNFEIVSYPKAGHLIEPPYSPLFKKAYNKTMGMTCWYGGYPGPHAVAQEDAWRRLLEHLNKYIPRTSTSDLHATSKL